ncbi:Isopeptidase T [Rhypophila decipiens]|uniref:Ubiquitin carboxyl-terminal hydrolase n=1 Tax=Rhypophila decipiens TaxID=261697 RepID=A0AAN6Y735_9PEZI|nr:Isopeptidase T [Rhypophila decipiens]
MGSGRVCPHVEEGNLKTPTPVDLIYREDCTQCFDSIDESAGLDVCLKCFNGGCNGIYKHAQAHYTSSGHPLVLNIRHVRKQVVRDEPPPKMFKLQIDAETDADRYDTFLTLNCRACNETDLDKSNALVEPVIKEIMKAATWAEKAAIPPWKPSECEHITMLISAYEHDEKKKKEEEEEKKKNKEAFEMNQAVRTDNDAEAPGDSGVPDQERMVIDTPKENSAPERAAFLRVKEGKFLESANLTNCSQCEMTENLWLCLTCGNVGCGQRNGNSHGKAHAQGEEHHLSVKLGSLAPGETPDVWCYACGGIETSTGLPYGESAKHPKLIPFLEHHGLDMTERKKTEKSLEEEQIEANRNWNFSMKNEDGEEATPLFGPGLTGLNNMGNTCYLASILQCLFDIPAFQKRFNLPAAQVQKPAEDLETQLRKMADGLLSGRYSKPEPSGIYQKGLTPAMFKHLIGRDHPEFSTAGQQDAYELMQHLLEKIATLQHPSELGNPAQVFRFAMEQRLQCRGCNKVRYTTEIHESLLVNVPVERIPSEDPKKQNYKPVSLKQCLDILTAPEEVQLTCSSCGSDGFTKRQQFKTFPEVLVVVARKIIQAGPTEFVKVDVPVIIDGDVLALDEYLSAGQQPGEDPLLDAPAPKAPAPKAPASKAPTFEPNAAALNDLLGMGFVEGRAVKGLFHTGNSDSVSAMNWVLDHAEDPDIDDPLVLSPASNEDDVVKEEDVQMLQGTGMGWDEMLIRKAIFKHGGDTEAAANGLFEGNTYDDVKLPAPKTIKTSPNGENLPGSSERPAKFELQSIACHKGSSIHVGHYVAFIRKEIDGKTQWVLFNDEKVALAVDADEMKKSAYVYFFKRV